MRRICINIILLLLCALYFMSCNKPSKGGGSNPPPPPPAPPVGIVSTLNLISPIPGEVIIEAEIPESNPQLLAAMYLQASALPPEQFKTGLVNIVQSTQVENSQSGTPIQNQSYSFDVNISQINEDEITLVRTARSAQTTNGGGGSLNMIKAVPVEDTIYRDDLSQVYNFSNSQNSIMLAPTMPPASTYNNYFNSQNQGAIQFQYQNCMPTGAVDYQKHFYIGKYRSPFGGSEVYAYASRHLVTQNYKCITSSYSNGTPAPPMTKEAQLLTEEFKIYAPRALLIGNFNFSDLNAGTVPLFQSQSKKIIDIGGSTGTILSKYELFIQAPTY